MWPQVGVDLGRSGPGVSTANQRGKGALVIRFVLASGSPARLETLRRAGVEPEVVVSGVDETGVQADRTTDVASRLAELKATTVARQIDGRALVLGCDSLLELDGRALGKPSDATDARACWRAMRGRSGVLHTGHALIDTTGASLVAAASTTVHFANVSDDEIEAYCATGEPLGVAGSFTIDGLGAWFVESIEGDHYNVVGLSLPLLRRMLRELGHALADIGYPVSRR
jgi:septum formation protein